jgi:CDP-4-dehydro-6-deoxyglucose reductase
MSFQETSAHIAETTFITEDIVSLRLVPEHYIDYQAGQYLQLLFEFGEFYFSIANAPLGKPEYVLHIRLSQPDLGRHLRSLIKKQAPVRLRVPFGQCDLTHINPHKPIIFLASGTGFAQSHAMLESLIATHDEREFQLFWGVRSHSALYLEDTLKQWENCHRGFRYVPLLTANPKEALVLSVLSMHPLDIKHWQVVLSGSFDMVYHIRDHLVLQGVLHENIFSDAFLFEEKP